jgi:predicted unusual protein kinase regulating ubiquinone biosynthesis (AarF/ABC1/UbiB family)
MKINPKIHINFSAPLILVEDFISGIAIYQKTKVEINPINITISENG